MLFSRGSSLPRDQPCLLGLLYWQTASLPSAPPGKPFIRQWKLNNRWGPIVGSCTLENELRLSYISREKLDSVYIKHFKTENQKGCNKKQELTWTELQSTAATRLLCPWKSPGKNAGVRCHPLLQGIFPTLGSNPGLQQCRRILYCQSHLGSPTALITDCETSEHWPFACSPVCLHFLSLCWWSKEAKIEWRDSRNLLSSPSSPFLFSFPRSFYEFSSRIWPEEKYKAGRVGVGNRWCKIMVT